MSKSAVAPPRVASRQRAAGEVTRRENRRRLLVAATREFAERGYRGATVARIAERAGVSVPTLYSAWGSKRALLRAVMETSVTGQPDAPLRAGSPPEVLAGAFVTADATDPRRLVTELAHRFRMLAERSAVGWQTYRDAIAVEVDLAADWQQLMHVRRESIRAMIDMFPPGWLRPDVSAVTLADTAWVVASPDAHDLLVRRAGYTYDQFERWVGATLCAVLLPDAASEATGMKG